MDFIGKLKEKAIKKKSVSASEALELFVEGTGNPYRVLAAASEIREHFKGKDIILCGMNHLLADTGDKCMPVCTTCSSIKADPESSPAKKMKTAGQILKDAIQAKKNGAEFFSIITGSESLKTKKEWTNICRIIMGINKSGIKPCLAAGTINANQAKPLKSAGLSRYCFNLKDDGKEDLKMIKAAGLSVCAGVGFGLGESFTQRIQQAETLRQLDVDSIALNIIDPAGGLQGSRMQPLSPMEILMTIAVFRFMLPDKDIKLCGGRKNNLRQLLPLAIIAGANSLMTGDYLNTTGRDSKLDHEMIADLGLLPTRDIDLCKCGEKGKRRCSASKTAKQSL